MKPQKKKRKRKRKTDKKKTEVTKCKWLTSAWDKVRMRWKLWAQYCMLETELDAVVPCDILWIKTTQTCTATEMSTLASNTEAHDAKKGSSEQGVKQWTGRGAVAREREKHLKVREERLRRNAQRKDSYCQQRGTEFCVWFGCLLVLVFFMNNMGYDTILLFQSTSRLLNTHHSVSQGVNENETWGQAAIAHPLEPPQYLVTICCWLRHSRPLSCPWVLRNTFSLSRCSLKEQVGWQPFQVKQTCWPTTRWRTGANSADSCFHLLEYPILHCVKHGITQAVTRNMESLGEPKSKGNWGTQTIFMNKRMLSHFFFSK